MAVILWNRLVECHNLRYKWVVSDGDSKAFVSVQHVYENCQVKTKCMGKHLNLKARMKGHLKDGNSVGGQGRLTKAKIKLQKVLRSGYPPEHIDQGQPFRGRCTLRNEEKHNCPYSRITYPWQTSQSTLSNWQRFLVQVVAGSRNRYRYQ